MQYRHTWTRHSMEKNKNPQYEYAIDALDFANSVYSMQFPRIHGFGKHFR